jgi:hypothetical protein
MCSIWHITVNFSKTGWHVFGGCTRDPQRLPERTATTLESQLVPQPIQVQVASRLRVRFPPEVCPRRRRASGWPCRRTRSTRSGTALDRAGLSPRDIAAYLGHADPSLTLGTYMSKTVGGGKAASTLDAVMGRG